MCVPEHAVIFVATNAIAFRQRLLGVWPASRYVSSAMRPRGTADVVSYMVIKDPQSREANRGAWLAANMVRRGDL